MRSLVARRTANASLKSGQWKRSKFTGVEILDKTVGVVGLGKIGQLVAQRLAAFGTHLIAYDPYVQPARAAQYGVRLVTLEELLREADIITIHLPKTPETLDLISERELAMVKPGVIIVNAARGGLINEDALAIALKEGRIGGVGLDVFASEPTTSSPLFEFDNVVVTPHLGASTDEAQEKAGTAVARSVKLALSGEFVPTRSTCRVARSPKTSVLAFRWQRSLAASSLRSLAESRLASRSRCVARLPPTTSRCSNSRY